MADGNELKAGDATWKGFADYENLGAALAKAHANVNTINDLNTRGGGNGEDDSSKQYLEQIKTGMPPLTDTLKMLDILVTQLGQTGQDVKKLFGDAEEQAAVLAKDWKAAGGDQ
ncbi:MULTISPECIES: hypothetical protein [unclassified Streptomyces]|jgi:hypothetical protein|uniref:hypothetical protein n=1 Tax=unclassified Streptomyces TaxID=2593676 RepID=UPI00081B9AE8|nr:MULTISPECIES: hypothetical protein [unclassified Streptomyces]MEE1746112.1 hypothetical protein [Streptomyces sp. JV184]MYQ86409.1 hypothetical protein [Streptomyces sp. SID4936]SCE22410.1 hypothetical protein GA0115234_1068197 [Streptomyces sp. DvalAA-43]